MMLFTSDSLTNITSPLDVDSLFYWFAADVGVTTNNNKVTQWNDLSGNGYHVTQADTSKAPTYSATGGPGSKPTMTFDGTNDFLASAAHFWGSDDLTVFVVMKHNNATLNQQESIIARLQTTTNERQWILYGRESALSYRNQFNWYNTGTSTASELREAYTGTKSTTWKVAAIIKEAANNTLTSWHYDGASQSISYGSSTGNATVLDNANNYVSIGAVNIRSTPVNFLLGSISEIIVFSRALTATERLAMENYLNRKYDLY